MAEPPGPVDPLRTTARTPRGTAELAAVVADDEPEIVAKNDLKENILATPAVIGGRLYFRTADHLICVGE